MSMKKDSMKNLQLALSDSNKSIELNKDQSILHKFYFTRGKIYQQMKEFQNSLSDFKKCIKLKKNESVEEIIQEWKKSKKLLMKQIYESVIMPKKSTMKKISNDDDLLILLQDPIIKKYFKNVKMNPQKVKKYLKNEKFKSVSQKILQKIQ